MTAMGIALVVIGAILRYAVSFQTNGVNLDLIGLILIVAGAVAGVIGLVQGRFVNQRIEKHVSSDGNHVIEETSQSGL